MKLSSITLAAAALALAGSAAMAQTTVDRTVHVGPNGEVTHVTKRVTTTTAPVIVHRHVVYHSPSWYHYHHTHVAYVEPHYRHHGEYVEHRVVRHEIVTDYNG